MGLLFGLGTMYVVWVALYTIAWLLEGTPGSWVDPALLLGATENSDCEWVETGRFQERCISTDE